MSSSDTSTVMVSGRVVAFRKLLDSCSDISCEDFDCSEAKIQRLDRRKKAIFRRERRLALLKDGGEMAGPRREKRRSVSLGSSRPTEQNTCPLNACSKKRWESEAKPNKTPPRCIRKANMQHGAYPDGDDEENSPCNSLEETSVSSTNTVSRWDSASSVGQDTSPELKLRRIKTWSHPDDAKVMVVRSLREPPKPPSRKTSGLNSLQETIKMLRV